MGNSLGDQLLKAGLVNRDKLNKAKKSKYRQQRAQRTRKDEAASEAAESARQVAAEKAARDRELNRQRKAAEERRAVQAQVLQLVEMNRLPRNDGDIAYNFQDGTAIKTIYVSEEIRDKLAHGLLAIVRFDAGYEVIPHVVAQKIRSRDQSCIVSCAAIQKETKEDDPYADYKVPDDLMW